MIVKVCGLTEAQNIKDVGALEPPPDMIGFNFYEKSARFVGDKLDPQAALSMPESVKRVGIYVNADESYIFKTAEKYRLHYAQLHGMETPSYCRSVQEVGLKVIKAFGISYSFDFLLLEDYQEYCDYFLFDARTAQFGGGGVAFDWAALESYTLSTPFLLAGGLGPELLPALIGLSHPQYVGVDVNSRFESYPGMKKTQVLGEFIRKLKTL